MGSQKSWLDSFANTTLGSYLFGLFGLVFLATLGFISIPVYIYRFILANVITPYFYRGTLGNIVSAFGTVFAHDIMTNHSPRCAIITSIIVEGTLTDEEVETTIRNRWMENRRIYPELQHYIDYFGGFLFWYEDKDFSLKNHLIFHDIQNTMSSDEESERFLVDYNESLINKRFPPKRSPWEMHIIRNYTNSKLSKCTNSDKNLTAVIFRCHHGLADGFSILFAVIEGIFGQSLSSMTIPPVKTFDSPDIFYRVRTLVSFFPKLLKDCGYFISLFFRERTPWHVSDKKKEWKQLGARSDLISIDKIKGIKNRLGASFSGVLLSCISSGVSKSMHSKAKGKQIDEIATLTPIPLANHPKGLTNHATVVVFDLPVELYLDPLDRLEQTEKALQIGKKSYVPIVSVLYAKLLGCHFAPVSNKLLRNQTIPMGLSSFPGPTKELIWNGKRGLTADFIAGAVTGVAGVGFMVLSYGEFIRIAATAENSIMEKEDVNDLIKNVCDEIDKLYSISLEF